MSDPRWSTTGSASPAEFELRVHEHYRRAYCHAYRLVGNREDAEDITQEAFLRAYRANDRYDQGRPFDRWLLRIVSNLAIDLLRSRPRLSVLSLDRPLAGDEGETLAADLPDHSADPADRLLHAVMDERIEQALVSLPTAFRMAVVLTDIEGLSYEEAAAAMGCAVGTIRSRLHRARVMMRNVVSGRPAGRRRARLRPATASALP